MVWMFAVLFLCTLASTIAGYWVGRGSPRRKLDRILIGVHKLTQQMEVVIMASAEIKAVLARIDAATNNIAEDIRGLKEKILAGMSPAEVAEVQAEAETLAVKLEGIAADTEDPVPAEPA